MRISDWSSDVGSSDLDRLAGGAADAAIEDAGAGVVVAGTRLARRGRAGVAGGRSGGSRAVSPAWPGPDAAGRGRRGARREAGARAALPARLCAVAGSLLRGTGAAAPDADGADQHSAAPFIGSGSSTDERRVEKMV